MSTLKIMRGKNTLSFIKTRVNYMKRKNTLKVNKNLYKERNFFVEKLKSMNQIEEIIKHKQRINKYITNQKKIQRLLVQKQINNIQAQEAANYILRISKRQEAIEEDLKIKGYLNFKDNLSEWPTCRIKDSLM